MLFMPFEVHMSLLLTFRWYLEPCGRFTFKCIPLFMIPVVITIFSLQINSKHPDLLYVILFRALMSVYFISPLTLKYQFMLCL
jgi:hypothetical protein